MIIMFFVYGGIQRENCVVNWGLIQCYF